MVKNSKPENKFPSVLVLLATYNGELYVKEQIDSIVSQEGVCTYVLVRDDGSIDSTVNIIENSGYKNISILRSDSKSRSAAQNFINLIAHSNFLNYDFVALSDQDDVWNNDKLIRAISTIESKGLDIYSSNVTAFWANGKTALVNKSQPQVKWDYWFEPAGPGCTYVLTQEVAIKLQKFIRNTEAKCINMHDWFIYAWARSNQLKWEIDGVSGLMYRQHAVNVVGINKGLVAAFYRVNKIRSGWYRSEILAMADLLGKSRHVVIRRVRSNRFFDKIWLIFNVNNFRRKMFDKIALAILFLLLK